MNAEAGKDVAQLGVLYEGPSFTALDTREMAWMTPGPGEAFHGTATKTKVLARAPGGWPMVQMLSRPRTATSSYPHGDPERHYHKTVREWVYLLTGQMAYREYPSEDDANGIPLLYKSGYFLDRRPGPNSWHGVDPNGNTEGYQGLEFRTGPKHAPGEAGNEEENVSKRARIRATEDPIGLTYTETSGATKTADAFVAYANIDVRVLDTREMEWTPLASGPFTNLQGARERTLSETEGGRPIFQQYFIPAGQEKGDQRVRYTPDGREIWMTLSGRLPALTSHGEQLTLREAIFLDMAEDMTIELSVGSRDSIGTQILVCHIDRMLNNGD